VAGREPEEGEHPTALFERRETAQLAAAVLPGTGRLDTIEVARLAEKVG